MQTAILLAMSQSGVITSGFTISLSKRWLILVVLVILRLKRLFNPENPTSKSMRLHKSLVFLLRDCLTSWACRKKKLSSGSERTRLLS